MTLDQQLKDAFALLDISNFRWLTAKEVKGLPPCTKKGSLTVPLNKEVERLMTRFGRAMRNNTGTRFTAEEVQTLMLTAIGQSAAMCLHYSEEDGEAIK